VHNKDMTRVRKVGEDFDQYQWNKIAPHPLVAWEWGEARKKMGIDVMRIGEFDQDTLTAAFQVTFHPIPFTFFTIGYMPRTTIPSAEVLDLLEVEAKKHQALFIKIEPYAPKSEDEIFLKRVVVSPHPLFPKWTQKLDLRLGEDELFMNLKPKWRYNVRLAQKNGVIVKEMTNQAGFQIFSDLYFQTTQRQKYRGHNRMYHHTIFESLKDSMSHILVAYYQDTPLAAYHLFLFHNILYYPYGGSSLEHRQVMASNLLMWEAIRFGKRHKAHTFDMWGSLSPDYEMEDGGWAGFTRFKAGYGTTFVEMIGSYDLVIDQILYKSYNIAHAARSRILKSL